MNGERELSLAVVGIPYDNADGSSRRFELLLCAAGDPVELRPEPTNEHDPRAIAVFSERGVQLGYLSAERCGWIGRMMADGAPVVAIFQEVLETSAVIRARFGGGNPTLPASGAPAASDSDFVPDPDPGIWGA
ncbi:HIRAN domain-containing protein [Sphingomonas leidyi]|uniref:HIRAN domain-containing protein n=1 Tax=Sphingomonas leidyi TaxID=68569 RepID=UPI0036D33539